MKTSQAFKIVLKSYIKNNHYGFICHVIEDNLSLNYKTKKHLCDILNTLLGVHCSLETWLIYKKGITNVWRDNEKIKNTRIAWLKHLIEHYESIGD